MSLKIGKSFLILSILILWTIYSPTAATAQSKEDQQIFLAESPPQTPLTEAKAAAVSEKIRIDRTADQFVAAPSSDDSRENIRGILETKTFDEATEKNAESNAERQAAVGDFAYRFPPTGARERKIKFYGSLKTNEKVFSFCASPAKTVLFDDAKNAVKPDDAQDVRAEGFRWRSAIGQTMMFLAIQHGYAMTQQKTREALKGKFWKDYVDSVKSLNGWADGGRFFTNYIAHPMQGAFLGHLQIQNDPKGLKQQFGASGDYWRSRLKAFAWSAVWSTQFEIGPVSQASIGNVGLKGKQTYIDIVVTPTVGTGWLIAEDAIDRFIIKRIERYTDNFIVKILARGLLNPTRTVANLFRFKEPWYRDRPPGR